MNDGIGGAETPQQNEAVKHSFKTLKTQARTLIGKDLGGRYQMSLLHRRELKDNGVQITQVKESLLWKQKAPIENTLKLGGLVMRLTQKENKISNTFFLFEQKVLEKGKRDIDLKSIILDNPTGKKESYKIDFNEDGTLKITQTDNKGIESEISSEQFAHLKEIDALKNTLSSADDNVKKTVKGATTFVGASIALAMAGVGIKHEITTGNEGLHTPYGNYKFLYERHDVGIDNKDIPDDTNIFYKEVSLRTELFKQPIDTVFRSEYSGLETPMIAKIPLSFMSPETFIKLTKNGSEIMIGDVRLSDKQENINIWLRSLEFGAGTHIILNRIFNKEKKLDLANNKQDFHHNLFKNINSLLAIWGVSPIVAFNLTMAGNSVPEQTSIKRISSRIQGLQSNLHPELVIVFFRDMMTAIKLIDAGIEYQRLNGNIANFCVQIEGGHSGVEDLIQLGPDKLRSLVLNWPTEFLKTVTEANGGIEDFSSSRIFKFPKNFQAEDWLTSSTSWSPVAERNISERKVTDYSLVKGLNQKLHSTELVMNQ